MSEAVEALERVRDTIDVLRLHYVRSHVPIGEWGLAYVHGLGKALEEIEKNIDQEGGDGRAWRRHSAREEGT